MILHFILFLNFFLPGVHCILSNSNQIFYAITNDSQIDFRLNDQINSYFLPKLNNDKGKCPHIIVTYESEWTAGIRVHVKIQPYKDNTMQVSKLRWTKINLIFKNIKSTITSGNWKVKVDGSQKTSNHLTILSFEPVDVSTFSQFHGYEEADNYKENEFDFIVEKNMYNKPSPLVHILFIPEMESDYAECSVSFQKEEETNNKEIEIIDEFIYQRRMLEQYISCSISHNQPTAVGWYHICGINPSNSMTCWGSNGYGQINVPTSNLFIQVSAYDYHTCGLTTNGTVLCWGAAYQSFNNFTYGPSILPNRTDMAMVSSGGLHGCGTTSSGMITCWGSNDFNQANTQPGIYSHVSAGYRHTCGVTENDKKIVCWGNCELGECKPPETNFNYTQVTCGNKYTCGLTTNGQVYCWGLDQYTNTIVPNNNYTFQYIAASKGGLHTCGILTNGTAICWGLASCYKNLPTTLTFVSLSVGARHVCGVATAGVLKCWGISTIVSDTTSFSTKSNNYCYKNLSNGTYGINYNDTSTNINSSISSFSGSTFLDPQDEVLNNSMSFGSNFLNISSYQFRKQIIAGKSYSCGLDEYGQGYCWGSTVLRINAKNAINSVQIGASFTYEMFCSLRLDGKINCWSAVNDANGNFINGVFDPPNDDFVQLSTKGYHTCGVKGNTKIKCWGFNDDLQCKVPDSNYLYVSAGGYHSCAITTTFEVICWGRNNYGQTVAPSKQKYRQISAGFTHTCGIKMDETLNCWGNNKYNQLNVPIDVLFWQVSAGWGHTCGITKNWILYCWGLNDYGQINAPTGNFSYVSAGISHSCGIKLDGSSLCWGDSSNGQLDSPTNVSSVYINVYNNILADGIRNNSLSSNACSQLNWQVLTGTGVCIEPAATGNIRKRRLQSNENNNVDRRKCQKPMTYDDAVYFCSLYGARLPTLLEATNSQLDKQTNCIEYSNSNNNYGIWTSTICTDLSNDKVSVPGPSSYKSGDINNNNNNNCNNNNNVAYPLCIAEVLPSACSFGHQCQQICINLSSTEYSCTCDDGFLLGNDGTSCYPSLTVRSALTCKQLNWNDHNNTNLCIENTLSECNIHKMTYLNAKSYCLERGARLPTRQEANILDIYKSNCSINNKYNKIWTSTYCSLTDNTFAFVSVSSINENCIKENELENVICIADKDIDECNLNKNACKHPSSCLNVEGTYTCICPNPNSQINEFGECIDITELTNKSNATCMELGWKRATDNICIQSKDLTYIDYNDNNNLLTCPPLMTYENAIHYCKSVGGRLPDMEDILNSTINNINLCYENKDVMIWTRTNCSRDCTPTVGTVSMLGKNKNDIIDYNITCYKDTDIAYPVCIADIDHSNIHTCENTGNELCEYSCTDIKDGFVCLCPINYYLDPENGTKCISYDNTKYKDNFVSKKSCTILGSRWKNSIQSQNNSNIDNITNIISQTCTNSKSIKIKKVWFYYRWIDRKVCSGLVDYSTANKLCMDIGARLPTYTEILLDSVASDDCNYNNITIWTSTTCFNEANTIYTILDKNDTENETYSFQGKVVGPGKYSFVNDNPITCISNNNNNITNQNLAYVRCIADKDIDECKLGLHNCSQLCFNQYNSYSCACNTGYALDPLDGKSCNKIINNTTFELSTISNKTCSELNWITNTNQSNICANARIHTYESPWYSYSYCEKEVDYESAYQICLSKGGRLPTYEEIKKGITINDGCGYAWYRTWTSTTCKTNNLISSNPSLGYITTSAFDYLNDSIPPICSDDLRILNNTNTNINTNTKWMAMVQCVADEGMDYCSSHEHTCESNENCVSKGTSYACICLNNDYELDLTGNDTKCTKKENNNELQTSKSCTELNWSSNNSNNNTICSSGLVYKNDYSFFSSTQSSNTYLNYYLSCSPFITGYDHAKKLCENIGGRLPTVYEVRNGIFIGDSCQLDNKKIWTSTICKNGLNSNILYNGIVLSKGNNGEYNRNNDECITTLDTSSAYVGCIANTQINNCLNNNTNDCDQICIPYGVSITNNKPYSCACHINYTLDTNLNKCIVNTENRNISLKSCHVLKDMGWIESKIDPTKCTKSSEIVNITYNTWGRIWNGFTWIWNNQDHSYKSCSGKQTYNNSINICNLNGGRLPSITDILNNTLIESTCGYDTRRIWTETSCGHHKIVTGAAISNYLTNEPLRCVDMNSSIELAYVICIADNY